MLRSIFGILMMMTPAAWADDRWDSYRFTRGDRWGVDSRDPVTAAQRDLAGIFRRARIDRHEADHFRDALRHLDIFQDRAFRGAFDRRSLDRAIDEMRDLARARQLHPRDRQIIARRIDDLQFLRDRRR
jgi:hypothetical protein